MWAVEFFTCEWLREVGLLISCIYINHITLHLTDWRLDPVGCLCADISMLPVSMPLCLSVYVSVFVPLSDDSWRRAVAAANQRHAWRAPVLALDTRQGILMLLATHGLGVPSSRWMNDIGRWWMTEPYTRYFIHLCSSFPAASGSCMDKNRSTADFRTSGIYIR